MTDKLGNQVEKEDTSSHFRNERGDLPFFGGVREEIKRRATTLSRQVNAATLVAW